MGKRISHRGPRVDSRSVFQPNARTKRGFSGHVKGSYRRIGPNAWDDYQFVSEDGGAIDVFPGVRIHVEAEGARFRMRKGGKVIVAEWTPSPAEQAAMGTNESPRTAFLGRCVELFKNKGGLGAAAFIAKSLGR